MEILEVAYLLLFSASLSSLSLSAPNSQSTVSNAIAFDVAGGLSLALLFQGLGSRLIDRYVQRVGESTNHGFTKCAVRQEAGFTGGYREGARASSWVRELPNLETTAPSRFLNPSSPEGNPKTNFTPSRKRGDTSRFLVHPCIVAFRISSCTALRNPIPTVVPFSSPLPCSSSSSQRKAQEIESATTQPRGGNSLAVCRPIICVPAVPRARPL